MSKTHQFQKEGRILAREQFHRLTPRFHEDLTPIHRMRLRRSRRRFPAPREGNVDDSGSMKTLATTA
jgi:hypothetical protein